MPSWKGKSKGSPFGYRIFVFILKRFGVLPSYALLQLVSIYYFFFSFQSTKHIFNYFRNIIGYSSLRSLLMVYTNYNLLGQGIIDRIVVMSGIPNKFSFNFDGVENLNEIAAGGKGGLLLSAHIGSWDIAGYLFKHIHTKINIVIFDGEHKGIKDYLESVTGKSSVNYILIKNDLSHIFKISEALAQNELVCMHADRFLEGNKTLTENFLGKQAKFPLGPFILAATYKVPVSFVFAVKESKFHYHLYASKPKVQTHSEKNLQIRQVLGNYVTEMENKARMYPEQWYNYYDFWK